MNTPTQIQVERAINHTLKMIDAYEKRQPLKGKHKAKILSLSPDLQACKIALTFTRIMEVECPIKETKDGYIVSLFGYKKQCYKFTKIEKKLKQTQAALEKYENKMP